MGEWAFHRKENPKLDILSLWKSKRTGRRIEKLRDHYREELLNASCRTIFGGHFLHDKLSSKCNVISVCDIPEPTGQGQAEICCL